MRILAIESSCDDSGIALLEYNDQFSQPKILANLVSSQIKIHAKWGGVVPMLAKREHQRNLAPLLKEALEKASLLSSSNHPESRIVRDEGSLPCRQAGIKYSSLRLRSAQNDKIKILQKILEREPELLKKLLPFLKKYQKPDVDYIAVTHGPGLEPALWVGINLARALSFFWDLPILAIDHIEGHVIANFVPSEKNGEIFNFQFSRPQRLSQTTCQIERGGQGAALAGAAIFNENHKTILPAMCLVVSGGHTQLVLIKKIGEYEIIGETRDDAAGEAFDKVAKMLGLGYPGGPAISRLASLDESRRAEKWNDHSTTRSLDHFPPKADPPQAGITNPFSFPRPMMNSGDFDFSFSGLKTAVLYTLQKMTKAQIKKSTPAIAAAFQQAVIDVLVQKTINSAKKYDTKSIWLAGGVAANQALRQSLEQTAQENNLDFAVPPNAYCADNAGMIALAAFYQIQQSRTKEVSWQDLKAEPNLRISQSQF